MFELLEEIHPGEILFEDFMKANLLTPSQLAEKIDVPLSRIYEIVNGSAPIGADIAVRLGLFFSVDPMFWMNLQTTYDKRMGGVGS